MRSNTFRAGLPKLWNMKCKECHFRIFGKIFKDTKGNKFCERCFESNQKNLDDFKT